MEATMEAGATGAPASSTIAALMTTSAPAWTRSDGTQTIKVGAGPDEATLVVISVPSGLAFGDKRPERPSYRRISFPGPGSSFPLAGGNRVSTGGTSFKAAAPGRAASAAGS